VAIETVDPRWRQWQPTPVFDAFWRFAAERQRIYLQRVSGMPAPWTTDPVLAEYRFTNVYRASDRVSQFLISHVIYDGRPRNPVDHALRVLLFKIFNRIETWQLLESALGELSAATFEASSCAAVLDDAMAQRTKVYSAAYIVPPLPGQGASGGRKHQGHLSLLARMLAAGEVERLLDAPSLQALVDRLRSWPGLGPFLAYQFAIDLNYTPVVNFSEDDCVIAGPGARDGLSKCFTGLGRTPPEDVIRAVWASQQAQFAQRNLVFPGLWGRPMSLIDTQNVFCEISKYARVAHPEVLGTAGRHRIKQRFRAAAAVPWPSFPPKWSVPVSLPVQRGVDPAVIF
jgi:hypothetical protein